MANFSYKGVDLDQRVDNILRGVLQLDPNIPDEELDSLAQEAEAEVLKSVGIEPQVSLPIEQSRFMTDPTPPREQPEKPVSMMEAGVDYDAGQSKEPGLYPEFAFGGTALNDPRRVRMRELARGMGTRGHAITLPDVIQSGQNIRDAAEYADLNLSLAEDNQGLTGSLPVEAAERSKFLVDQISRQEDALTAMLGIGAGQAAVGAAQRLLGPALARVAGKAFQPSSFGRFLGQTQRASDLAEKFPYQHGKYLLTAGESKGVGQSIQSLLRKADLAVKSGDDTLAATLRKQAAELNDGIKAMAMRRSPGTPPLQAPSPRNVGTNRAAPWASPNNTPARQVLARDAARTAIEVGAPAATVGALTAEGDTSPAEGAVEGLTDPLTYVPGAAALLPSVARAVGQKWNAWNLGRKGSVGDRSRGLNAGRAKGTYELAEMQDALPGPAQTVQFGNIEAKKILDDLVAERQKTVSRVGEAEKPLYALDGPVDTTPILSRLEKFDEQFSNRSDYIDPESRKQAEKVRQHLTREDRYRDPQTGVVRHPGKQPREKFISRGQPSRSATVYDEVADQPVIDPYTGLPHQRRGPGHTTNISEEHVKVLGEPKGGPTTQEVLARDPLTGAKLVPGDTRLQPRQTRTPVIPDQVEQVVDLPEATWRDVISEKQRLQREATWGMGTTPENSAARQLGGAAASGVKEMAKAETDPARRVAARRYARATTGAAKRFKQLEKQSEAVARERDIWKTVDSQDNVKANAQEKAGNQLSRLGDETKAAGSVRARFNEWNPETMRSEPKLGRKGMDALDRMDEAAARAGTEFGMPNLSRPYLYAGNLVIQNLEALQTKLPLKLREASPTGPSARVAGNVAKYAAALAKQRRLEEERAARVQAVIAEAEKKKAEKKERVSPPKRSAR